MKFQLDQAKPSAIPMDPGYLNIKQKEEIEEEILPTREKYMSLIGALLYLAVSCRPDIAISASILGRKVSKPTKADWTEAKRTLRYLYSTADMKLTLGGAGDLIGYADADWAGDKTDRKSNTGFVFQLGKGSISWTARKQQCVTLSSTEAEYVAISEASKELMWLLKLLADLGEKIQKPVTIKEDNQSCISLLQAEGESQRTKHIDTKFNFIRDICNNGTLKVKYCPTEFMKADILTKPLARIKHGMLRESLGIHYIALEEECSRSKP